MSLLRVGIVGAGAMAGYHAKRFRKISDVSVAAVCDRDREHARAFAAEFGIPAVFTDVGALVASGAVDAVAVASRDGHHPEAVLASLDRSLPVFCEKPLARTLSAAVAMELASRRSGVPAVVNFSKRNMPVFGRAATFIASGRLGTVQKAFLSYEQSWLLQDSWGDYRTTPKLLWRLSEADSTFGVIGDLGSHLFDAACILVGPADPGSVRVVAARRFVPDAADARYFPGPTACESFRATARAGNGTELEFAASFRSPGHLDDVTIEIAGSACSLRIDATASREAFFLKRAGEDAWAPAGVEPVFHVPTYERFVAAAGGRPVPDGLTPDFAAGLLVQKLVDACATGAAGVV